MNMSVTLFAFPQTNEQEFHSKLENEKSMKSREKLEFSLISGVSNVMNVPVSPVLAALVLTAAILFAIVCIVLATIYRKHSHK